MDSIQQQFRFLEEGVIDLKNYVPTDKDPLSIFSAVMSNVLLFFLIFGLSATVEVKNLRHQLTNRFAIFTGVAMQFLIMPLLGFSAVFMFRDSGFTQAMGISLLVVTASPGGSYSNWWCSLFNAELALSVAMTSVSSVLSIGLLPANLFLYSWLSYTVIAPPEDGEEMNVMQALDFTAIFISLGVVLGAIFIGLYCGYKYDNAKFHSRANHFGSICGLALILFSAFLGSGAGGAETNFWSLPWSFYVGTAFPCVVGITLANVISRCFKLNPPETVAIAIECCYQNTAIATSVAVTMFSDPTQRAEAVSVPLFYGFVEAVIIGVYCLWAWKVGWTKAPANEKICVVISKTYEVHEEEEDEMEFDPDEHQNAHAGGLKGWVAQLFVPREHEHAMRNADDQVSSDKDRKRFYSADVTVATTTTTPPGTPSLENTPQENATITEETMHDLEAPSFLPQGTGLGIEVVHECPSVEEQQSPSVEEAASVENLASQQEHQAPIISDTEEHHC